MVNKRALKVFRTSAGFEDVYIAAPSQKAALEAWGARRNLFAQGAAEIVTDPELAKAALAHPGQVLRVSRGTTAEHLAAARTSSSTKAKATPPERAKEKQSPPKPKPRPNREKLDAARAGLERRQKEFETAETKLVKEIEVLKAQLAERKRENGKELARLCEGVEEQERLYRRALADWER
ncbi:MULTISPECIES: hypothetical protein [unclassified Novosphingobium]|uniref:hypothetical protein n=1 Tax=unclassified Novosphingobium TaxID=2644732 RepID=UPI0014413EEF|nr:MULTISPECIES: hypothetical protein [unclassified Novosphingobium]MBB3359558.1 hypothetical protein [Novosphingobium sp. BK256]MBB3376076.1 hypothetical protein [Novosphingobium sp. BK280]MBB3380330.1 hypothetical protein [Novosphingobium sp. BK258]MBB3422871.1 hypothetical protein [Novosphingobium sp. BK267]MBB3450841.1 hypothetical protein [Novosphingobium sp. BK352]